MKARERKQREKKREKAKSCDSPGASADVDIDRADSMQYHSASLLNLYRRESQLRSSDLIAEPEAFNWIVGSRL